MSRVGGPVFGQYQRRYVWPLAGLALVCSAAVGFGLLALFGPLLGLALFLAFSWAALDRLLLVGNGWLRRGVAQRLDEVGEPVETEDLFVGLAHPCHFGTLRRRLIETDDDVGFLRLSPLGLYYHGDAVAFEVPAEAITEVRLVYGWGHLVPWARVEVVIEGGEPYDSVVFDSRRFTSHALCRQDNRRLYQRLRELMTAADRRARLGAEVGETLSVSA